MAGNCTPSPESQIAVVTRWELVGVHTHENVPDEVPGVSREESEDGEEGDARAPAQSTDREWSGEWPKDVGGDLASINDRALF